VLLIASLYSPWSSADFSLIFSTPYVVHDAPKTHQFKRKKYFFLILGRVIISDPIKGTPLHMPHLVLSTPLCGTWRRPCMLLCHLPVTSFVSSVLPARSYIQLGGLQARPDLSNDKSWLFLHGEQEKGK